MTFSFLISFRIHHRCDDALLCPDQYGYRGRISFAITVLHSLSATTMKKILLQQPRYAAENAAQWE